MRAVSSTLVIALICAAGAVQAQSQAGDLRSVESFDAITDKTARSRALFEEAGKVILSPRCLNCHPKGDRPMQTDAMQPHVPKVVRGPDNTGVSALRCTTCHQGFNYEESGVPGHPLWKLAPRSMAWQGTSLGQICASIKDTKANGGRSLAATEEHMGHDTLVGWGWRPGGTRTPAPGTQAQFGALISAWVATGAACPAS